MNRFFIITVLFILVQTLGAQQIVEWNELKTITDKNQCTVYYDKDGKEPLHGSFRIKRGLDEEVLSLSEGLIKGDYRRYRHGVLRESGKYTKGKRDGLFIKYYQDGVTPEKETPMKHGKINGTVRTYFSDGTLESDKVYRQSVEHGRERRFDNKTGEQIFEVNYVDGKKEGKEWTISIDKDGSRSEIIQYYRNGKKEGPFSYICTQEGKILISIEGEYTDGEKSGHWKQYDASDGETYEWDR